MQAEINALPGYPDNLDHPIVIFGVNGIGLEAGNAETCKDRTIPWLQDVAGEDVWGSWRVNYRDVVILNAANEPVAVFNLTEHNLANPTEYAALKQQLLDAAGEGLFGGE